ncbi:MAG: endo-1,4-beta-xylanase [Flavobacteriaceae bacterium]
MHRVILLLLLFFSISSICQNENGLAYLYRDHFLLGSIYHGSVLGNNKLNPNQDQEHKIISKEFNTITAENCMKPLFLLDQNGNYNFEESDKFVDYALENNLTIVGHTLVWKNSAPEWFFKDEKGNTISREILILRLKDYIKTVVSRYKGKISYWDVVNEAVDVFKSDDNKSYAALKPSPWYDIIGEDYIKIAFEAAHDADPNCKLIYNDYNMYQTEKTDFIIDMVNSLKSEGVPIHGIGSQGHMFLNHPSLDKVEYWLRKISEANISLHITELDVSVLPNAWKHRGASVEDRFDLAQEFNPYPNYIPSSKLKQQAKRYKSLFKLFLKYSHTIERVTFWGVWDGNSWRNYLPMKGRTDYPLLFDRSFKPKPAYFMLRDLVRKK